jgi:multidrug efflux system outer membrane protein
MNSFLNRVGFSKGLRGVVCALLLMNSFPRLALAQGTQGTKGFQPPRVQKPSGFRGEETNGVADQDSIGDLKWFEVFKDPELQKLVRTAMVQNYDLRAAVARIDSARANLV